MIRLATPSDAKEIADIYNYYINNTVTTFEEVSLGIKPSLFRKHSRVHIFCKINDTVQIPQIYILEFRLERN